MSQSESRLKALQDARDVFKYAAGNLLYVEGRKRTINAFHFYDGDGQYPQAFLNNWYNTYGADDLAPPVINKVKSIINHVSGVEIQSRFRTAYRTHSSKEEDEELAKGLTHWGYFVQESEDLPLIQSFQFRDGLICGVGWGNLYLQYDKICADYVHPLSMIYDADDFSPLMTDQQHVIRQHWVSKQTALMMWGKKYKKEIEAIFGDQFVPSGDCYSPEFFNRCMEWIDDYAIMGGNGYGARAMVLEVQRKEERTYFCGYDIDGRYFETFDEELADKIVHKESELKEKRGFQIIRTVFCKDAVFEHGPLVPNIPNGSFTYVPFVYSRRSYDACLEGWLTSMEDIQRIINYSKHKELIMVNSVRAIVDTGALVEGQTPEDLREELARNDSVIFKNKDANISLHPNIDLAASQINTAKRLDEELQQVSGMYGDSFGQPTNATAAVSINSRARNSFKNQIIGFDNLMFMKKREAKLILDLMQGSGIENIAIPILDDDEKDEIILNLTYTDHNGESIISNNIRSIPVNVYVEQTHDYESSPEEERETFQALLANPNAMTILQSPQLLKRSGMRAWKKIAEEMQLINQQKMQNENMTESGIPAQMQGGVPAGGGGVNENTSNPMMAIQGGL